MPIARVLFAVLAALVAARAAAYPEGAPWGAANPDAEENCGDCHYDYEPVADSDALVIDGLPDEAVAGREYEFVIRFAAAAAEVAGFQLLAVAGDAAAGTLRATGDDVETIGAAGRSVRPAVVAGGNASWQLAWTAPRQPARVEFLLAASAANDDQSPLGDRVHYRRQAAEVRDAR